MGIYIHPIGLTDTQEAAFQSEGYQAAVGLTLSTASAVWRRAGLAWPEAKWYDPVCDEAGFLPWYCGEYAVTEDTVKSLDAAFDPEWEKAGLHGAITMAVQCALLMGVGISWS